jgi:hypothetical protein
MAIKKPTAIPNSNGGIQSSGNFTLSKHLLGVDGSNVLNDTSEWMQINQVAWKTLFLRPLSQVVGSNITTGQVRVEFAITLAAVSPEVNTKAAHSVVLTQAAPLLNLEAPYGYVRVVVAAADPLMMQVDFHGIGV